MNKPTPKSINENPKFSDLRWQFSNILKSVASIEMPVTMKSTVRKTLMLNLISLISTLLS